MPAATRKPRPKHRPPPTEQLAAALEALGDGVLLLANEPGRGGLPILHANAAFEAMSGHDAASLVGRGHQFLHVERDALAKLRRWLKTARPGDPALKGEGHLKRSDGSRLYASWTVGLLPAARGRPAQLVATYHDMTAKQRLQEDLLHAQRLEAVGRLAGGVAHDFNNLLSVINGYCEIMAGQPAVRRHCARQLHEIHQAGLKATSLVRRLLAFSRRQTLSPQVVRLDQLVRDNADILGRLLGPDKHLHLQLDAAGANIRVDPAQLQQVLINLVVNARDALAPGGAVTLGTSLRTPQRGGAGDRPRGTGVELTVADNGSGMDADTQAHLFEPFFTTKDEGRGTGLGLALVYGIVQQSGGHIGVRSALGAGTTFTLRFPRVRGEVSPLSGTLAPLPSTKGRETVLLIEADEVVRKMLAGILTADGYRVHPVETPAAAAALLDQKAIPVELVIVDPGHRHAASEALIRRLHADRPDLSVLCTSTSGANPFPA
ncbi:MAG: ATP-binding protein, partial [Verrucomicrobiota bacterium]